MNPIFKALAALRRGADSQRPIQGEGISLKYTPKGVIVSRIRNDEIAPTQPLVQSKLSYFITVPLTITLAGSISIETNQGTPTPNTGDPNSYYPFAFPAGGYQITFLDNAFNPIGVDGTISVSHGTVSQMTVTSVPDPFTLPPGQRIYTFNWELMMSVGPLTPIPGNFQQGRYIFRQAPPAGAVYAVVGKPGNNVFGSPALNIGQFVIHSSADIGTGGSSI